MSSARDPAPQDILRVPSLGIQAKFSMQRRGTRILMVEEPARLGQQHLLHNNRHSMSSILELAVSTAMLLQVPRGALHLVETHSF